MTQLVSYKCMVALVMNLVGNAENTQRLHMPAMTDTSHVFSVPIRSDGCCLLYYAPY